MNNWLFYLEVGRWVTAARATSKIHIISLTCWQCYPCPCASPWASPCLRWKRIWRCTSYWWALCLSSDCWRWWDVSTSWKYCCMCCQPPLMLFPNLVCVAFVLFGCLLGRGVVKPIVESAENHFLRHHQRSPKCPVLVKISTLEVGVSEIGTTKNWHFAREMRQLWG